MSTIDVFSACSCSVRPIRGFTLKRKALAALFASGAAAAAFSTVLPATAAAQWQPDRFQFFCGTPFYVSTLEAWLNVLRQEGVLGSYHAKDYRNYVENPGRELDRPAPGCLDPGRLAESEDMARHALLQFKDVGAAVGLQFTDPSPARLGPVVVNDAGEQVVRIYVDPTYDGIGEADVRPRPGGNGIEEWSVAHVRFSPDHIANQPAWSRYRTIAHELAHVIQSAQQVRSDRSAEGPLAMWIGEGTADALAAEFLHRRGYGAQPPLSVRGSRSVYGLRPYHRAFTWISGSDDRDRHGNALVTHYTASSFWTFLADRFFDGSFHYLIDWFAIPDLQQGSDDWLAWADALLRWDAGGIDHPLYLVFPEFIAHYAAWGTKKYPHIGEEEWLSEAFGGCHTVTLSPAEPVSDLTLDLEQISAACVKVIVGGVPSGQAVSVQFMAHDSDTDRLDNLHLTAARMEHTVGGRTFDCFEESKRAGPASLCVHKPFTGASGRSLAEPDMGGVTSSGSGFVKTWLGVEQVTAGDGLIENVYFLVHTPVDPRDREHDYRFSQAKQTARLQIGFERSILAMNEGTSTSLASASVNGSAGLGLIPMRGGDAPEVSSVNPMGAMAIPMGAATDPDVMTRTMFLQNTPMGTLLPGGGGEGCEGVCMLLLENHEARPGFFGESELSSIATVALALEDPIPFGGTGTYEAKVFTCPGEECDAIGFGDARVTVRQFTDQVLHLAVSGTYCMMTSPASINCPNPQSFEGEILKPFAWVYDPGRTFNSIDTPGMEEYRESLSKAMSGMLPGLAGTWRRRVDPRPGDPPPEAAPPPAGAGGAAALPPCDCSCAGQERLLAALEAYQVALQAAQSARAQLPPAPPELQTLMRCTMECAERWGQCGGPPPSPGFSLRDAPPPPPAPRDPRHLQTPHPTR